MEEGAGKRGELEGDEMGKHKKRGARLARAGALQSNRNLRWLTWKDIFVDQNHHALWHQDDWAASEIRSEPEVQVQEHYG